MQRQTAGPKAKRGVRAKTPRPQKVEISRESNGLYLPAWSVLLMLGTVFFVAFAIVGGVILLGGTPAAENSPRIVIITADPSSIPQGGIPPTSGLLPNIGGASGAIPSFPLEGPTLPPVILTPTPQQIAVGNSIVVNSPDPVNVRFAAGTDQEFLFFANDGETFTVIGGPTQATGYTWWQVEDPADPSRAGWIASLFIELQQP